MKHPIPDRPTHSVATKTEGHTVAILVYDGVKLLDVAGPAEVFGEANRLGAHYRIVLLSPSGREVTTSTGIRMAVDGDPGTALSSHSFLIAGGDIYPRAAGPVEGRRRRTTLRLPTSRRHRLCRRVISLMLRHRA